MQHVYFCQVLLRQGPFDQRLGNDIDWINHKLISGKGLTGDTFLLIFPTYENKVKFVESGLYLKQTDRLHYQVAKTPTICQFEVEKDHCHSMLVKLTF